MLLVESCKIHGRRVKKVKGQSDSCCVAVVCCSRLLLLVVATEVGRIGCIHDMVRVEGKEEWSGCVVLLGLLSYRATSVGDIFGFLFFFLLKRGRSFRPMRWQQRACACSR